ncbi:MAG: glycogen/starch synthase [Candidatus Korobacteraceae bacterium]|jgi:starch synthase
MTRTNGHSILFAAAEVSPIVSVGGLAEVVRFLPRALREAGYDVRVAIPDYQPLLNKVHRLSVGNELLVEVGKQSFRATLSEATIDDGTPVYLVGGSPGFENVSNVKKDVYSQPTVQDYCFFGKAILEFVRRGLHEPFWAPDVLHLHDFHAGFAGIYLKTTDAMLEKSDLRAVFTVHNLGFPGSFDRGSLPELGLPNSLDTTTGMEFYGKLSPLKGSLLLSDIITAVSPTYAFEILSKAYGERLDGVLNSIYRQGRLRGILNGIDRDGLREEAERGDPSFTLEPDFEAFCERKSQLKATLCRKYGLLYARERPVLVIMGRWGWQKGWPIFTELLLNGYLADFNVIIETWASAGQDSILMDQLRQYAMRNPQTVVVVEGEPRSLLRLAGPDFVLLPSVYEPCGLIQMEAMCFATIPVVRKTGGLADTVFDGENGFVFDVPLGVNDLENGTQAFFNAVRELGSTLRKALLVYRNPERLVAYRKACFESDNSWQRRVPSYARLYDDVLRMPPVTFGG